MPTPPCSEPLHIERNPLGEFTFYQDYVIAEWHKPEIDAFDLIKMEKFAKSVYGESGTWGYISNRTHAAVSNPAAVYQMLRLNIAPKAVAIVTYSMRSFIVAKLEQEHCKNVPLEIFSKLEEARQWVEATVKALKNKEVAGNELIDSSPFSAA